MSDQSPEDLPPRPSDQAPIPWKVKAGFRLRCVVMNKNMRGLPLEMGL
jgi:hypothetical protein